MSINAVTIQTQKTQRILSLNTAARFNQWVYRLNANQLGKLESNFGLWTDPLPLCSVPRVQKVGHCLISACVRERGKEHNVFHNRML